MQKEIRNLHNRYLLDVGAALLTDRMLKTTNPEDGVGRMSMSEYAQCMADGFRAIAARGDLTEIGKVAVKKSLKGEFAQWQAEAPSLFEAATRKAGWFSILCPNPSLQDIGEAFLKADDAALRVHLTVTLPKVQFWTDWLRETHGFPIVLDNNVSVSRVH